MADVWDPFADPAAENGLQYQDSHGDVASVWKEQEEERQNRLEMARRRVEEEEEEAKKSRNENNLQSGKISSQTEDIQNIKGDILHLAPYCSSKYGDQELVELAVRCYWVTFTSWKETVQDFGDDVKSARDYLFRDWLARKEKDPILVPQSAVLLSASPSRHQTYGEQMSRKQVAPEFLSWEMQRRKEAAKTRIEAAETGAARKVTTNLEFKYQNNFNMPEMRTHFSEDAIRRAAAEEAARKAEVIAAEAAARAEEALKAMNAANLFRGGFMSIRVQDEEEQDRKRLSKEAQEAAEFAISSAERAEDARRLVKEFDLQQSTNDDNFQHQRCSQLDDASKSRSRIGGFSSVSKESKVSGHSIGQLGFSKAARCEDNRALPSYEELLAGLDTGELEARSIPIQHFKSSTHHNSANDSSSSSSSAKGHGAETKIIDIKRGDVPEDLRAFAAAAGAAARAKGSAVDSKGKSKGRGYDKERGKNKFKLEDYIRNQNTAAAVLASQMAAKAEEDFLARQCESLSCEEDDQSSLLPGSSSSSAPLPMEYFLEQMKSWRQSSLGRVALDAIDRCQKDVEDPS